jgi:hypothetical protein
MKPTLLRMLDQDRRFTLFAFTFTLKGMTSARVISIGIIRVKIQPVPVLKRFDKMP